MLYYVTLSNRKQADETVREMQIYDADNMYICPLIAFSHLTDNDADLITLRLDLLTMCDKLIVASDVTPEMREEINLANRIGMEVEYL